MENQEMRSRLLQVIQALNCVSVSGKANLANLAGSISVLEGILQQLPEEKEEP